ncbi:MAG: hypothetical protein AAGB11_10600 [Pseudomonadota bacterium]
MWRVAAVVALLVATTTGPRAEPTIGSFEAYCEFFVGLKSLDRNGCAVGAVTGPATIEVWFATSAALSDEITVRLDSGTDGGPPLPVIGFPDQLGALVAVGGVVRDGGLFSAFTIQPTPQ